VSVPSNVIQQLVDLRQPGGHARLELRRLVLDARLLDPLRVAPSVCSIVRFRPRWRTGASATSSGLFDAAIARTGSRRVSAASSFA
jgi:hypothetical protein